MMLSLALLLAAAAPPAPAAPAASPPPPTLYQRVEQRIAADPAAIAALGHPAPQMHEIDWLIGTWEVSSHLESRGGPPGTGTTIVTPALGGAWLEMRSVFGYGAQSVFYVGYSAIEGHWVYATLDSLMSANHGTAPAWTGDHIAFEGDFTLVGMSAHLRQTVERQDPDNFSITAEERVDGGWRRLAVSYYHRRRAGL